MVRGESDLNSSLVKPKVRFQDDCVWPGGTSPTILMMKQWTKDQFHRIRVTAHRTQHNPEIMEKEILLSTCREIKDEV